MKTNYLVKVTKMQRETHTIDLSEAEVKAILLEAVNWPNGKVEFDSAIGDAIDGCTITRIIEITEEE